MNQFRLKVIPTAVADNGLTYGATLRLRASLPSGIVDADQAYLFARGGFGTVEAGTAFNPNLSQHVIAPTNFGTGGIDGDWAVGNIGWIQNQLTFLEPYFGGGYTITTFMKEANKINYLSPRVLSDGDGSTGLMGTLSYAPSNRSVFGNSKRSLINTDPVGARPIGYGRARAYANCMGGSEPIGCNYHDVYELGFRYDETVAGVTVRASGARLAGSTKSVNFGTLQRFNDLEAWQAGLQLGAGGVLIGGSYANAGRSSYPHQTAATGTLYLDDQSTWTAGISYETGPVSVGFNYQWGHDAGDLSVPGGRSAALYAVGVTYRLAPGLNTALEYMRSETRNEIGFSHDALGFGPAASGDADLILWKVQVVF